MVGRRLLAPAFLACLALLGPGGGITLASENTDGGQAGASSLEPDADAWREVERLSADQKGKYAPSVPVMACGMGESKGCRKSCLFPLLSDE